MLKRLHFMIFLYFSAAPFYSWYWKKVSSWDLIFLMTLLALYKSWWSSLWSSSSPPPPPPSWWWSWLLTYTRDRRTATATSWIRCSVCTWNIFIIIILNIIIVLIIAMMASIIVITFVTKPTQELKSRPVPHFHQLWITISRVAFFFFFILGLSCLFKQSIRIHKSQTYVSSKANPISQYQF